MKKNRIFLKYNNEFLSLNPPKTLSMKYENKNFIIYSTITDIELDIGSNGGFNIETYEMCNNVFNEIKFIGNNIKELINIHNKFLIDINKYSEINF